MLYKNDIIYKLGKLDIAEIKKKYPKFPLRLTFPESRVRKSHLKHNIHPDKPTSISFPFHASVKTKSGTEHWRYAEHKIIGTNGNTVFTPNSLVLRGTRVLQETDMELVYWLTKCCSVMEGGDNYNGRKAKCAIEDLVGVAEKKVAKEEEMATIKALIYSSSVGLGEEKLRLVAKAFFVNAVDDLSHAQTKLAVEKEIQRRKSDGIEKFLHLVKHEPTLTIKANIQNAIDNELIKFDVKRRMWTWITEEGRSNEDIAQIGAGSDPNEALFDYYLGDRSFAEQLEASLQGRSVIPV